MTAGIFPRVALALGLGLVPSFIAFALFLWSAGLGLWVLIALYVEMAGLGVLALGLGVFWRLYTQASRPSWPFIFFASGAINIIAWSVLTFLGGMEPDDVQAAGYIDLTQSFGMIAFGVAVIWSLAGAVFGWMESRFAHIARR